MVGRTYILVKAFLCALVLTCRNLAVHTQFVKNKVMQNVSCGVLYTALIGFDRFFGCCQRVFFIYLHWRGAFGVARFDKLGDARASTRGASDRRDSTSFSYVFLTIISQTTQSGVDVL